MYQTIYDFTYVLDSNMLQDSGRLIADANPCENLLPASAQIFIAI